MARRRNADIVSAGDGAGGTKNMPSVSIKRVPQRRARQWSDEEIHAIVAEVCRRMGNGEELIRILRSSDDLPSPDAFYTWLDAFPGLDRSYRRAREDLADHIDAEIADLARDVTAENYNATRVAIDALKWRAARLNPKRYGDRMQTDIDAQVTVNTTVLDATALHPDQRDALRAALLQRQRAKAG